jgi:hypothetical protein
VTESPKQSTPETLTKRNLYERIRARVAPLGGADDLELPPREMVREPPSFADFDAVVSG